MATCPICRGKVQGTQGSGKGRTSKRPERPYGGTLCGSCVREVMKTRAKLQSGMITDKEVSPKYRQYV